MSTCTCDGTLRLISLFDGIGGFPLAFSRAGVETVATVEIDKAAAGVAADHFPNAKHFADVTEVTADDLLGSGFCPVHGVVSAGWPCTDLSLAGLRLGLGGARSGLVGEVFRLLLGIQPRWFVLENVPGLLSSVCPCPGGGACAGGRRTIRDDNGFAVRTERVECSAIHPVRGGSCGRAWGRGGLFIGPGRCMALHGGGMGTVLRRLGECGYGLAYRVLDAQHFGVPQRRRRVVIVGRLGDAAGPAQVLLEPESGGRHPAPGRAARASASRRAGRGTAGAGRVANALTSNMAGGGGGADDNTAQGGHLIALTLTAREGKGGADASEDGAGRGTPLVSVDLTQVTSGQNRSNPQPGDPAGTLAAASRPAVAFGHTNGIDVQASEKVAPTMRAGHNVGGGSVATAAAVRRLTPVECERLQGYPDSWTATSHGREQADSPRYRQLGNSIAVPVFEWAAQRMVAVDKASR